MERERHTYARHPNGHDGTCQFAIKADKDVITCVLLVFTVNARQDVPYGQAAHRPRRQEQR
jgi:hypothetical protein